MSFEDWLYKKANQNAHNEILAFLMMIIGMHLLIGGLVITTIAIGEPLLFSFMTQRPTTSSETLGLVLTTTGFAIVSVGFLLVVYYDKEASWYMRETEKSTTRKKKNTDRTVNQALEEWLGKTKKDAG
ncbi:MAG: hypothetical protein QXM22_04015 [Candidatus Bathyarchaeia archaeon]